MFKKYGSNLIWITLLVFAIPVALAKTTVKHSAPPKKAPPKQPSGTIRYKAPGSNQWQTHQAAPKPPSGTIRYKDASGNWQTWQKK